MKNKQDELKLLQHCLYPISRPLSGEKKVKVLVVQLCPTLYDPMDCSLPGSLVHGILQARIVEWVAIPFSRGSFQPRDQTQVSYIALNLERSVLHFILYLIFLSDINFAILKGGLASK